jgi:hypothetical protein
MAQRDEMAWHENLMNLIFSPVLSWKVEQVWHCSSMHLTLKLIQNSSVLAQCVAVYTSE